MEDLPQLPLGPTEKRFGYLEWDEYFVAATILRAAVDHGNDPKLNTVVLLNARQIIMGSASDDKCDHANSTTDGHAEVKAIQEASTYSNRPNSTIYTILFPCDKCAEALINNGVKEVIYLRDCVNDICNDAKKRFQMAAVQFRKFEPKRSQVVLDLQQFNSPPTP